jgi:hypothetical protein
MSNLKLTFFDSVELEDIDINDPRVKFYLIDVAEENGNNLGFKFCATIQDLSSLQSDPESRKKKYWPVTLTQLNQADKNILFSEPGEVPSHKKMRMQIFKTAQEINDVFRFNPPFNPLTTESKKFGVTTQQQNQLSSPLDHLSSQQRAEILNRLRPLINTPRRTSPHTHILYGAHGGTVIRHNFFGYTPVHRGDRQQIPINPDILNLINQGFITEGEYTDVFTSDERMNFVHTHQLIAKRLLTVEAAKQLTNPQARILGERQIITLIEQEKLSIDDAKALSSDQCTRLYFAQTLISAGALTVPSALQLQLNQRQVVSLQNPGIVVLIQEGRLTIQQMLALNSSDAFNYDGTQPLISANKLTFDEGSLAHL